MAERAPWRRWLTRIIRPVEAGFVYGAFALFRLLPLERASAIGGALARWIGPHLGLTRRARKNLRRVFPDKPAAEIEAIVRDMWENLGRVATEYPHLSRMRAFPPNNCIEVYGLERIEMARARGRPIIFFAGHLANWEIAAIVAKQYGTLLHLIYRTANNPWVEAIYRKGRGDVAAGLIAKGAEGAKQAVEVLRRGQPLGILIDQKMNDGIAVRFFGQDAMTAPALARLALKFDCTILPVQVERLDGARFRLTVHPPLALARTGNRTRDIHDIMARANALLEDWIRQRPGQWLWLHRRWPD